MELLENLNHAHDEAKRTQGSVNTVASSLDLLKYAFKAMEDKEPVSYQRMEHDDLAKLAREYNVFIYQIGMVVSGVVDECYGVDMKFGNTISTLNENIDQQKRLDQLHSALLKRTIKTTFNELSSEEKEKLFFEYDALLKDTELLLNGDYKSFDDDMTLPISQSKQASE